MNRLEAEIAGLAGLPARELRRIWNGLGCGEPLVRASRDLLIRQIAHRLQERAYGGLAPAIQRRLRALAQPSPVPGKGGGTSRPVLLWPGTRLVRDWGGRTHTVLVLDEGFEYEGVRHPSLTHIARQITGTHWSGPRFFGLRRSARPPGGAGDHG